MPYAECVFDLALPPGVVFNGSPSPVNSGAASADVMAGFKCDTGYDVGTITSAKCTDGILSVKHTCGKTGGCCETT